MSRQLTLSGRAHAVGHALVHIATAPDVSLEVTTITPRHRGSEGMISISYKDVGRQAEIRKMVERQVKINSEARKRVPKDFWGNAAIENVYGQVHATSPRCARSGVAPRQAPLEI